MRVLIATQTYDPTINGQGAFVVSLARRLPREGLDVVVLRPAAGRAAEAQDGLRVEDVSAVSLAPFYPEVSVTAFPDRQVSRLIDQHVPDVIHINDHYPLCRAVARAARQRGIPLVATNHFLPDNIVPHVPVLRGFGAGRRLLERVLWDMVLAVVNQADVVTTPTETAAGYLRARGARAPVRAISCGVDVERFRPRRDVDRVAVRGRYGLRARSTVFLYVGRVDRDKRLDVAIQAVRLLDRPGLRPGARDGVQLGIAGRGREATELSRLAARLGLADRVVFTGFVPAEDLPALLDSADVFVMPSEAELQSIATLEAMATGKPVLAANARALPELVSDGVNGYLFRPGCAEDLAEKMAMLADDPARLAAMGEASRARAAWHRVENTVARYSQLYREVAASRLRAAA